MIYFDFLVETPSFRTWNCWRSWKKPRKLQPLLGDLSWPDGLWQIALNAETWWLEISGRNVNYDSSWSDFLAELKKQWYYVLKSWMWDDRNTSGSAIALCNYHLVMTNSSPWKDPPVFHRLNHLFQGLVTVPFWEYWTSPYSSHYRPYTYWLGDVQWGHLMTHLFLWAIFQRVPILMIHGSASSICRSPGRPCIGQSEFRGRDKKKRGAEVVCGASGERNGNRKLMEIGWKIDGIGWKMDGKWMEIDGNLMEIWWTFDGDWMETWWKFDGHLMEIGWKLDGILIENWWKFDGDWMETWWNFDWKLMEIWWRLDGNLMEFWLKIDGDWLKIDSGRTLEDQDSSTARFEKLANSQDSTCVQADPGVSFGFLCKRHFQLGKLVTGRPRILSYWKEQMCGYTWIADSLHSRLSSNSNYSQFPIPKQHSFKS